MKLSVILIIAVACAGWIAFALYSNHATETKHKFTQFCAENKGIAVRDLDNKMRCVPMLGRGK